MTVKMEKHGDTCHVRISGEMTIYQAAALRQELLDIVGQCGNVTLDLSHVTEMDTAGLQLLLACQRETGGCNKIMHIEAATPALRDFLRLANVAECFGLPPETETSPSAG